MYTVRLTLLCSSAVLSAALSGLWRNLKLCLFVFTLRFFSLFLWQGIWIRERNADKTQLHWSCFQAFASSLLVCARGPKSGYRNWQVFQRRNTTPSSGPTEYYRIRLLRLLIFSARVSVFLQLTFEGDTHRETEREREGERGGGRERIKYRLILKMCVLLQTSKRACTCVCVGLRVRSVQCGI